MIPESSLAASTHARPELALPEFALDGCTPLGAALLAAGAPTFHAAAAHVQALPYGRPGGDGPLAVLTERRGTCSSKHHLLATLAHDHAHDHAQVELMVGLYLMHDANTPGVGPALARAGLAAVPEAHCYLRTGGRRVDLTGLPPGSESPFDTLMEEHVVAPSALVSWKRAYHHRALAAWARAWDFDPALVWATREAAIAALVSTATTRVPSARGVTPLERPRLVRHPTEVPTTSQHATAS